MGDTATEGSPVMAFFSWHQPQRKPWEPQRSNQQTSWLDCPLLLTVTPLRHWAWQYPLLLFTLIDYSCFKCECGDVAFWFTEKSTGGHQAVTGGEGNDITWARHDQLCLLELHLDGSRQTPLYGASSKSLDLGGCMLCYNHSVLPQWCRDALPDFLETFVYRHNFKFQVIFMHCEMIFSFWFPSTI